MKLVLDTNVLWNDSFLRTPSLVTLATEQKGCGYSLYVPEVVVQEQVKHFREKRDELLRETRRVESLFSSLSTNRPPRLVPKPSVEAYEGELRARVKELRINVLPHPKVSHEALVQRAIQGRKPFGTDKQRGFHDVLIWETVLQLSDAGEPVYLVSNDSDFGKDELDAGLAAEVATRRAGTVTLLKSIQSAVETHVTPHLTAISTLKAELTSGALAPFVSEWLAENLDRELSRYEFTKRELGLQGNFHGGTWDLTRRVIETTATDAKKTEEGLVIVRLEVRVEGEITYVEYVPDSVRPVPDMFTDYQTEGRIAVVQFEWLFDPVRNEVKNSSLVSVRLP